MSMGATFGPKGKPVYYGSETKDWGSVSNWGTLSEEVDCVGAEEGMFVSVGMTTLDGASGSQAALHNNLHMHGYVKSGGDVVVVVLSNMAQGGSINLTSGTLYVKATFG